MLPYYHDHFDYSKTIVFVDGILFIKYKEPKDAETGRKIGELIYQLQTERIVMKITTPADHRALLMESLEAVIEGRINVGQANAIVGLSGEIHKSIRQEWDMRTYISENINIKNGSIIKLIGE